jgi:periplasmic glucans biosynthesis protein
VKQTRRDFIQTLALGLISSMPFSSQIWAQQARGLQNGDVFSFDKLRDLASTLAKKSYEQPNTELPSELEGLTSEQYKNIRTRDTANVWLGKSHGVILEPLTRGFIYRAPVQISVIESGRIRTLNFDPKQYEYGRAVTLENISNLGLSGFKLRGSFNTGNAATDFAVFQAASFFRAVSKGQNFGVMARGLAIGPAEPRGEEFPFFRAFWIEEPQGTGQIHIYALLDSPSCTGAYRLVFSPGENTTTDVEATIFARADMSHMGIAPMTSMFYFAPNDRRNIDDVRPAAHESNGLAMLSGKGEWIWRSVQNPETLQISAFVDENPQGFGLMERERSLSGFEDDDQHFERRPSLWVEPLKPFGQGVITLLEIPTDTDVHDNIMAYWRPKEPVKAGTSKDFSYKLHWCWSPPRAPSHAKVSQVRTGRSSGRRRKTMVEFAAPATWATEAPAGLRASLSSHPVPVSEPTITYIEAERRVRVTFDFDPASETAVELRLVLMAESGVVSETWLYRWTP